MKDDCVEITVGQLTKEIGALIGIPMEAADRVIRYLKMNKN